MKEREIAGLRCSDVLARLPDLLDGALDAGETDRVREHVAACNWCERFGGEYAAAAAALRAHLVADQPSPALAELRGRVRRLVMHD